jgi:hypothetical protein
MVYGRDEVIPGMASRSIGERIDSMLCTATLLAALAIAQSPPTSALGPGVDSAKSSKLKEGDFARVNRLGPEGLPESSGIYPSLEEARAVGRAFAEQTRTKRPPSIEGLIQVGHNTPARIERISAVDVAGVETPYAQVTLGSGVLKGQRFWIRLDRLRDARGPDPARKALPDEPANEPKKPISPRDLFWDPEYHPKAGDSAILGMRNVAIGGHDGVILIPTPDVLTALSRRNDLNGLCAASGTRATVLQIGRGQEAANGQAGFPPVQVKLASGPFAGHIGWVLGPQLSRPEVFERESGRAADPPADPPAGQPEARRIAGGKRAPQRPPEDSSPVAGDLVLIDVADNPSSTGNYVEVVGRIRNTSDRPLKLVRVTASFEDSSGKLVRSAWTYCDPKTIEPGGQGSFEVSAQSDVRYAGYRLSFQEQDAAIPWVNRSGKDVHD